MTITHQGLPVDGYRPQSSHAVALVNENKKIEERLLRILDTLALAAPGDIDQRWLAIARSHFEQGFMAMNRAVFQPGRITLPEDERTYAADRAREEAAAAAERQADAREG